MLTKMWRNHNPPTLLVGMLNGAAPLEDSMAVMHSIKHRITMRL